MQVLNAPRRWARADDRYYEENIMESYFHPEIDHQSVEYPQGVISIQRTKAAASKERRLLDTTSIRLCCALLSLWCFGCLYLAYSDHPPTDSLTRV